MVTERSLQARIPVVVAAAIHSRAGIVSQLRKVQGFGVVATATSRTTWRSW
jgi:hypothetical protein